MENDFADFMNVMNADNNAENQTGSDRGLVLVLASSMDALLRRILVKYLADVPKTQEAVFKFQGALGSFSAKIDMCLLLGLIDEEEHYCLNALRSIRNEFAHQLGFNLSVAKATSLAQNIYERMDASTLSEREDARGKLHSGIHVLMVRLHQRGAAAAGRRITMAAKQDTPEFETW